MDLQSSANAAHGNSISNLESTFSESLHIQDAQQSEHASEWVDNYDQAEDNICRVLEQQEKKVIFPCLKKFATFAYTGITLPPSSSDEDDEEVDTSSTKSLPEQSAHQTYSRSISLPTPLKLVSAMKGSRERQGPSQMKLTVKWAPDVYDPVPTSLSHTVKNKKQQKFKNKKTEKKKNGKKCRKGNSSRGGDGRDKQCRKISGTSDLCYKSPVSCDKVIEASTGLDALDVGSQDCYCGTSFYKKSVTEVHYPVAEAL